MIVTSIEEGLQLIAGAVLVGVLGFIVFIGFYVIFKLVARWLKRI